MMSRNFKYLKIWFGVWTKPRKLSVINPVSRPNLLLVFSEYQLCTGIKRGLFERSTYTNCCGWKQNSQEIVWILLYQIVSNLGTCIPRTWLLDGGNKSRRQNLDRETSCEVDSKWFWRRVQWLWLALSKGPNWVGVFPLTWGQKQIQFPKHRIFCFLKYPTVEEVQKPSNSALFKVSGRKTEEM
jgi:hypothetical protein